MSHDDYPEWHEIDDWLASLGIDPDCDAEVRGPGDSRSVEVRIPTGDDADEYLCGLGSAWRDRFGAAPIEFKAYVEVPWPGFTVTNFTLTDKDGKTVLESGSGILTTTITWQPEIT